MNQLRNRTAWALSLAAALAFSTASAWAQFKAAAPTGTVVQPRASIAQNTDTRGIAFSHQGKMVWLTDGPKAQLWDLETSEAKMTLEFRSSEHSDWHSANILCVATSPDSKTLASGDHNGVVKIWDPETGEVKTTADLKQGEVTSLTWSPDGSVLAAAQDKLIKLVNPATGRVTGTIEAPKFTRFNIITYSPDGRLLATYDSGNKVRLFAAKTGMPGKTLEIPERSPGRGYQAAETIVFSPDSRTLATGGAHTGYLLDVATGRIRATLPHEARENQEDHVQGVAFSADGKLVATACQDGTAKLWDPATGKLKATLKAQYGLHIIAFAPDGKTVVAGSSESTKIYDVPQK